MTNVEPKNLNRREHTAPCRTKKDRRTGTSLAARCRRFLLFPLFLTVFLFTLLSCGRAEGASAPAVPSAPDLSADPAANPEPSAGWVWLDMTDSDLSKGSLVLVNAEHSFDPAPVSAVSVYEHKTMSYQVKDIYLSVTPETVEALNRWMDAFREATGHVNVNIVAGFRTVADQTALYDNALESKGRDYAEAYLALPGCSEHHTGLAVDLDTYDFETGASWGFDGTGDYAWAVDHAWEYGFIQRYPPEKSGITGISYESWHYRYVGLPHALLMKEKNLCLEEYIDFLRDVTFDGAPLTVSWGGQTWRIYYAEGLRVPVPAGSEYEISGNNVDGFIVTVRE